MQRISENRFILSPSDLSSFTACEFAFLRTFDHKLGRVDEPPQNSTELSRHAAVLGDMHERRQLAAYRAAGAVAEIARAEVEPPFTEILAAQHETLEALKNGVPVVFQATFFVPPAEHEGQLNLGFVGFADFITKTDSGEYQVQDTKLSTQAKVTALLQLAAYAQQLRSHSIAVSGQVALLHGDGSTSLHQLRDIEPFLWRRREAMVAALETRWQQRGADGQRSSAAPVTLTDASVGACLRCRVCREEMLATDDLGLIAGMPPRVRQELMAKQVTTLPELVARGADISAGTLSLESATQPQLQRLCWQAQGQLLSSKGTRRHLVFKPHALSAVQHPEAADLLVSLHRNTFYSAPSAAPGRSHTGLSFAATVASLDCEAEVITADTIKAEKRLLTLVMGSIIERLSTDENARIYHYGRHFRTQLARLGARHRSYEAQIDRLLTSSNLVDLQQVVRQGLLLGSDNYELVTVASYAGEDPAAAAAAHTGSDAYTDPDTLQLLHAQKLSAKGERREEFGAQIHAAATVEAALLNRVHAWLLSLKEEQHLSTKRPEARRLELDERVAEELKAKRFAVTEQAKQYQGLAQETQDPDETVAFELLAAAFDYHRRERVSHDEELYWRLNTTPDDWGLGKEMLLVDAASALVSDWEQPAGRKRSVSRRLQLRGVSAESEPFAVGKKVRLVYEHPAPPGVRQVAASGRWYQDAEVTFAADGVFEFVENLKPGVAPYGAAPLAVLPGPPLSTATLEASLMQWATGLRMPAALNGQPLRVSDAGWELLKRARPRLRGGAPLLQADTAEVQQFAAACGLDPKIAAVARACELLDRSVLPVQGPPGAGKSYVTARVVRYLVERGWKIGVVSQSHAVVEHLLTGVVRAGVPQQRVLKPMDSKRPAPEYAEAAFTAVRSVRNLEKPLSEAAAAGHGVVVGGTAWTFSNTTVFADGALDLLVVDEGGQFGMVSTLAALRAARNLLLVGDPQQLPQVSQGEHPVPIDASALGWLMGDAATLSPERGFFLSESWRMWPVLCDVVSDLSYEGKLRAANTERAVITGWQQQGLYWHPVKHSGNSSESVQEAARVVALCQKALGEARVTEPGQLPRPLSQAEIIVVAPYNAQVSLVRQTLDQAGLTGVRVGTVDRFQGQEAQLAIITLAASNVKENPRGIEFLLNRNRLNVAISRAKWSAHLVSAPQLAAAEPNTAAELVCLAGYLRLLASATEL